MQVPLKWECISSIVGVLLPAGSICQKLTNGLCIGIYVGDGGRGSCQVCSVWKLLTNYSVEMILGKYIDLNLEKYRNAPRAPTQSEMCEKLLLIFLSASTEVEEEEGLERGRKMQL